MKGTRVWFLVREGSTCQAAPKLGCHNYWTQVVEPVLHNKRSHHSEKPSHHNKDQTRAVKKKQIILKKIFLRSMSICLQALGIKLETILHLSGNQCLKVVQVTSQSWFICLPCLQGNQYIISISTSHSVVSDSLWPHGLQHARPPCPSPIHNRKCKY